MPSLEEYKAQIAKQRRKSGIVVNLDVLESWNESLAKENRQLGFQVTFLTRSVFVLSVVVAMAVALVLVLSIMLVGYG